MEKKTYTQFKRELLKDEKIKQAYEKLGPEFSVIEMIIKKRTERGLSQKELAKKLGTKQSAISRLERGMINPTMTFLNKLAFVFGKKLIIEFK